MAIASDAARWAALSAEAAPPGDFSVAVERLFGVVRTTVEDDGAEFSTTAISILSKVSGDVGYSAPRLAFDWLSTGGLSFGGALGYQTDGEDGDVTLGLVDFAMFPHLEHPALPHNTMANAERWASKLHGPAYAVDDDTAFKVVDGSVEVVSEGQWRLLNG